jgi:hypothetical protein
VRPQSPRRDLPTFQLRVVGIKAEVTQTREVCNYHLGAFNIAARGRSYLKRPMH